MADATVTFTASDLFSLGSNFIAQSSNDVDTNSYAQINKADGDNNSESNAFDLRNEYTCVYRWSAATGLGAALPDVGSVTGTKLVTQVQIDMSNDDFPTITITGHQHDAATHTSQNVYALPSAMQTLITGAFGAYDIFVKDSSTAACQSETLTFSAEHIDALDCSGAHFAGHTFRGMMTGSATHVGAVTGVATTNGAFVIDTQDSTTSNEGFVTTVTNAHAFIART